ncbi:MAG: 3-oxoacyl-[acyl-carrier-protein] synthase 3 [Hyphomicrobiaceae bacterium hypho_1]
MAIIRSVIRGVGAYLPSQVMTNDDMAKILDTNDTWITERTGIKSRHIASESEFTSDLGIAAAKQALLRAGSSPSDIDLIICATATPDRTFPSTSVKIQHALGAKKGAAFDIQAVCSGFIYALATADNFLKSGQSKQALVIGAETFSRILDWTDRTTCVLFGDGAGAVVLEAQPQSGTCEDRGILLSQLRSDGSFENMLYVDGGPSSTMTVGHLRMNGREVFRHAIQKISDIIEETLTMSGHTASEIDLFVPHQANLRILDGIAKKLGIENNKVMKTLHHHGNTSAASIPLALNQAFQENRIKKGDMVLMEALGGGFTWGATLVRW